MDIACTELTGPCFRTGFRAGGQSSGDSSEGSALMSDSPVPGGPGKYTKGKVLKLFLVSIFCLALAGGALLSAHGTYKHVVSHEETEDAYLTAHLHQVSARVNGTVDKVLVDDNEHVDAGQLLVLLDPRDLKVRVEHALANLEQAQRKAKAALSSVSFQNTRAQGQDLDARGTVDNALAAIARAEAAVREAGARIESAQAQFAAKDAELARAEADYNRYETLLKEGAVSTSQRDAAKRDYLVALENRKEAREHIKQANEVLSQSLQSVKTSEADLTRAQAQVHFARAGAIQTQVSDDEYKTSLAAVSAAQAALDEARLNLSYTSIVAPRSGRVGKKTVELGQRVEPGQPLMTIVSDNPWVVANFKETQIKEMKPGQRVEIRIDSIPGRKFEGVVQSFSPASGSSFSILPSDNATGNFTKIVQRIPVKILFSGTSTHGFEERLVPGLSVLASVETVPAPKSEQHLALVP